MSPTAWPVRAVPALLLIGCGVDLPERPYDMPIDCRAEAAPVLSTVEEAVALLDADGDGALTDMDLNAGETTVILGLSGTHEATGEESEPGYSIHTDWSGSLFAYPSDFAYWGVQVRTNCLPMMNVFVNFGDEALPQGVVTPGDFAGRGIGIDVVVLEMGATDATLDFTIHATAVTGDRVSGYMSGSGSAALMRMIPEEALTGQRLAVAAFAFREILDEEAE